MSIGSFFKSMLGGGSPAEPQADEPVDYNGFGIEAAPLNEGGKFRVAGFISGELNGESKRIQFIRADECSSRDEAVELALFKARQIIDQQGENLLEKTHL